MSDSDGDFSDELLELAGAGEKRRKKSSASRSKRRKAADTPKSESEDEYESEDEAANPYPLEGKYIDEEDREHLMQLPEIERENILSQRLDEIQRFQDKRNLVQMLREQRGEMDNAAKGSKRSHHARGATKEKARKLDELKAKRKAKSEKKRIKVSSPKRERSSSPMDMEMSSEEEEDGQISKQQQEEERESRLLGNSAHPEDVEITYSDLEKCQIPRDKLRQFAFMPWFEELVKGAWVRYMIGPDENKRPIYRACEVLGIGPPASKPYKIDNEFLDTMLELRYGSAVKAFPMDKVSNSSMTEIEFQRLKRTCEHEKCKLPTKRAIEKKVQQYTDLPQHTLTEAEVTAMVARKAQCIRHLPDSRSALSKAALERTELVRKRDLAQRRRDFIESAQIEVLISELDSTMVSSYGVMKGQEKGKEDILAKVNERNRQANREGVGRAEAAEAERKRRAWKARAFANSRAGTPGILNADSPGSTPLGTPKLGATSTLATLAPPDTASTSTSGSPSKRSISPLPGKGPLGKRTFESIVASSVEIDLGDF